jgi:hypothetical protein
MCTILNRCRASSATSCDYVSPCGAGGFTSLLGLACATRRATCSIASGTDGSRRGTKEGHRGIRSQDEGSRPMKSFCMLLLLLTGITVSSAWASPPNFEREVLLLRCYRFHPHMKVLTWEDSWERYHDQETTEKKVKSTPALAFADFRGT